MANWWKDVEVSYIHYMHTCTTHYCTYTIYSLCVSSVISKTLFLLFLHPVKPIIFMILTKNILKSSWYMSMIMIMNMILIIVEVLLVLGLRLGLGSWLLILEGSKSLSRYAHKAIYYYFLFFLHISCDPCALATERRRFKTDNTTLDSTSISTQTLS